MHFEAITKILQQAEAYRPVETRALEATMGMFPFDDKIINVDETPMRLAILTDKIIDFNQLKKVDNPIMFQQGRSPTVGGLFSDYVFGTTPDERRRTYGYIDLKQKFIHPYVYEVLKEVLQKIDKVCMGESSWTVLEDGTLTEIKDKADPNYNEDDTGLDWFIENYHKIKFDEKESLGRKERLKFLNGLTDDEIFITKWIVVPVFYRDVDLSTGKPSVPQLNYQYTDLIKFVNFIKTGSAGFMMNKAKYHVESALIAIRKYGQSLIEKKNGAFHQTVLGKSIDRSARSVISAPIMSDYETSEEYPIDIFHIGIPLAKCCEIGYDFVMKWTLDFFEREFNNVKKKSVYVKSKDGKLELQDIEIADNMEIFTADYVKKKMKIYINTYGGRFAPIMMKLKDGRDCYMVFTGRGYSRDLKHPLNSTISNRPLTWTDVFYMAAWETLRDKYVYCTRYPLIDYFGIYPCQCFPLSTIRTMPAMIGSTVYPYYPIINTKMPDEDVSTQFVDTVTMSNLYLQGLGGDYDGDMVTVKMVYTIEANQEAEEILNSVKHYISIQGNLTQVLTNESYLTFFNMTKIS